MSPDIHEFNRKTPFVLYQQSPDAKVTLYFWLIEDYRLEQPKLLIKYDFRVHFTSLDQSGAIFQAALPEAGIFDPARNERWIRNITCFV